MKQKTNLKRTLSAILLLAAMMLPACTSETPSDTPDDVKTTTNAESTAANDSTPNYLTLEADWKGESFRVMTINNSDLPQFTNFEVVAESENGDIVNDAVYRRNMTIEDKYNVHIVDVPIVDTNKGSATDVYQALNTHTMSGEEVAELFFIAIRDSGLVMASGLTRDLYTLPYIDFDAPYYSSRTNDMISMDGKLLLTTSDFSLVDKKRAYILAYNRGLLGEYSDLVLEDLVREGTWTFDEFVKLCEMVSVDLDGDGDIDNYDQWGVGMDSPNGMISFGVGMGLQMIAKDSDGDLVNNSLEPKTVNIVEKLYKAFNENKYNGYTCQQAESRGWDLGGVSRDSLSGVLFKEGRQLFNTTFPQALSGYSSVEGLDYGILAWPKYDEAQDDYYAFADYYGAVLFGVPYIASKTDLAGFMIEVLSGYSTDTSLNAYYEVSCKVKHVYDETSAEMLDLCLSGRTFDLGSMFNWGGMYTGVYQQIMNTPSFTFVSASEAIVDTVENEMADTLEAIKSANQG